MRTPLLSLALAVLLATPASAITLGTFEFDDTRFGNSVVESDGGAFSVTGWMNANAPVNAGMPASLTGANFDTGIANIGTGGFVSYTIGYDNPIANDAGDDFGVVTARFSFDDFTLAVSTDGVNFTADQILPSASGISTGVGRTYYTESGGPFASTLYVTPIDLDAFGIGAGEEIVAIRVGGDTQLDLVRVAAFGVPEPSALALLATVAGAFGVLRRRA